MLKNLIVNEHMGYHSVNVVRIKELFGCLELTFVVHLVLMARLFVQKCERKKNKLNNRRARLRPNKKYTKPTAITR